MPIKFYPIFFNFLFLLSLPMSICAQITKGNWLVGGTASFSSFRSNVEGNRRSTSFDIKPRAGYFLIDKFSAGVQLTFYSFNGTGRNGWSYYSYGVGPFLRYYFFKPSKKFNLILEPSLSFLTTKYPDNRMKSRTLSILAGPALFVNSNVAFELLAGYERTSEEFGAIEDNIPINFGVQVYLHKRRQH